MENKLVVCVFLLLVGCVVAAKDANIIYSQHLQSTEDTEKDDWLHDEVDGLSPEYKGLGEVQDMDEFGEDIEADEDGESVKVMHKDLKLRSNIAILGHDEKHHYVLTERACANCERDLLSDPVIGDVDGGSTVLLKKNTDYVVGESHDTLRMATSKIKEKGIEVGTILATPSGIYEVLKISVNNDLPEWSELDCKTRALEDAFETGEFKATTGVMDFDTVKDVDTGEVHELKDSEPMTREKAEELARDAQNLHDDVAAGMISFFKTGLLSDMDDATSGISDELDEDDRNEYQQDVDDARDRVAAGVNEIESVIRGGWGDQVVSDFDAGYGRSISRAFRRVGRSIRRGVRRIGRGLKKAGKAIGRAAKKIGKGILNVAKKGWGVLKKLGKAVWKFIKSLMSFKWNMKKSVIKLRKEFTGLKLLDKTFTKKHKSKNGNGKLVVNLLVKLVRIGFQFTPGFTFKGRIETFKFKYLKTSVWGRFKFWMDTLSRITAKYQYEYSKDLFQASKTITFSIGPVPVAITIRFKLTAGATVTVDGYAQVTYGVKENFNFEVGAEYKNRFGLIMKKKRKSTKTGPDLNMCINAYAEAYLQPEIGAFLYGLAGPTFSLQPYLAFEFVGDGRRLCNGNRPKTKGLIRDTDDDDIEDDHELNEAFAQYDNAVQQFVKEYAAHLKKNEVDNVADQDEDGRYGRRLRRLFKRALRMRRRRRRRGGRKTRRRSSSSRKFKSSSPRRPSTTASSSHPSYWGIKLGIRAHVGVELTLFGKFTIASWSKQLFDKSVTLANGCVNIGAKCLPGGVPKIKSKGSKKGRKGGKGRRRRRSRRRRRPRRHRRRRRRPRRRRRSRRRRRPRRCRRRRRRPRRRRRRRRRSRKRRRPRRRRIPSFRRATRKIGRSIKRGFKRAVRRVRKRVRKRVKKFVRKRAKKFVRKRAKKFVRKIGRRMRKRVRKTSRPFGRFVRKTGRPFGRRMRKRVRKTGRRMRKRVRKFGRKIVKRGRRIKRRVGRRVKRGTRKTRRRRRVCRRIKRGSLTMLVGRRASKSVKRSLRKQLKKLNSTKRRRSTKQRRRKSSKKIIHGFGLNKFVGKLSTIRPPKTDSVKALAAKIVGKVRRGRAAVEARWNKAKAKVIKTAQRLSKGSRTRFRQIFRSHIAPVVRKAKKEYRRLVKRVVRNNRCYRKKVCRCPRGFSKSKFMLWKKLRDQVKAIRRAEITPAQVANQQLVKLSKIGGNGAKLCAKMNKVKGIERRPGFSAFMKSCKMIAKFTKKTGRLAHKVNYRVRKFGKMVMKQGEKMQHIRKGIVFAKLVKTPEKLGCKCRMVRRCVSKRGLYRTAVRVVRGVKVKANKTIKKIIKRKPAAKKIYVTRKARGDRKKKRVVKQQKKKKKESKKIAHVPEKKSSKVNLHKLTKRIDRIEHVLKKQVD